MLTRELTQVSAQLEEEETHVQPQLERMVRAATKRTSRQGHAWCALSRCSFAHAPRTTHLFRARKRRERFAWVSGVGAQ